MARCIAKISGDGNLYYRYLRYSNTCPELLKEFEQDMLKEFGNVHFTPGVGNSGTPFRQVHKKAIINRFLEYLTDYRSLKIFIPEDIKNSSKDIKKEYLRALYDDEGSPSLRLAIKTKEWKRSITLASNSIKILEETKIILLNDFDIKTNRIIRNRPKSDYDKSYILSITGKDNMIKYRNRIGFLHPDKIRRLNLVLKSYEATSKNVVKFNELIKEYKVSSEPYFPYAVQYNMERRLS